MLHSLRELDRLLRKLDTKLLRWDAVCYNWPNLPVQEHAAPNTLLLPLKQVGYYHPIRSRDSRRVMLDAVNGKISYSELPTVYVSAVHRSLFDALRKRTGKVFHSDCPDVYSGFALAHLVRKYWTVDAPLSISALSGASNGVAVLYLKNQSNIARDFSSLNQSRKTGRNWPAWIPDLPVFSSYSAESFHCAKAALFPGDTEMQVDRRQLVQLAMSEYRSADETEWQMLREVVRKSTADDAALLAWFDAEYGGKSLATCPPAPLHHLKRYGGPYMQLDAAEFGVKDVWEAALLCEKVLGYHRDGINAHVHQEQIASPSSVSVAAGTASPSPVAADAPRDGVYQQETEAMLLKSLAGKVSRKTFIDVGAEKGSFARELLELGFDGVLFEPFSAHLPVLEELVSHTRSKVFPFAIDATDHEGRLHIATDEVGQPLDYFHSLQAAPSATLFHHDEGVPVICRSLESLAQEGVIAPEVGVLKIDTEGNDLRVLQGMGVVRAEVLMCEYVTPQLYPDWSCSFPDALMAAARAMGYEHCIAVSRFDEHEVVELDPVHFVDGQWGNLIFTSAAILHSARIDVEKIRAGRQEHHVKLCFREHLELFQKEDMIQDQARQLHEKEAVIRQLADALENLQTELGAKHAKIAELKDKVTLLKEKNENLRMKR